MIKKFSWFGLSLAAANACVQAATPTPPIQTMTREAREVAGALVAQIGGELKRAFEFSGPLRAVVVCRYSVPELSSNLARQTGWRVSRVSLRPRNPTLAMPDPWEQQVLANFDLRAANGEPAAGLEFAEVVDEPAGKYFRYMKALPVAEICLACHGPDETRSDAIKAQLATEYPHDRAVDYRVGDVRGAVTIKRPLAAR
ncbi:MAG: DUF3365 domain-containing protein [Burkholderiaceae bacterium]